MTHLIHLFLLSAAFSLPAIAQETTKEVKTVSVTNVDSETSVHHASLGTSVHHASLGTSIHHASSGSSVHHAPSGASVHAPFPGTKSKWHEGDRYDFKFEGRDAIVVAPLKAAPGNPWIWRPAFFDAFSNADKALLERGFHVAYLDVTNDYASPRSIKLGNSFYKEMVENHHLSSKVVMEGLSRGGLYTLIWASRNPNSIACLYLDAPLCDVFTCLKKLHKRSWETLLKEWELTEETLDRFDGNPIDNLEPLAKAGVPIISVCGDADLSVPIEENMLVVRNRYQALGGTVELIIKPGCGHHPHGLEDPQPIVEFIVSHQPEAKK